jgi:hypothetical protein
MSTLVVEKRATQRQPPQPSPIQKVTGLGKYQRLILGALEERPRFTNELWKLCQGSGLAKALQDSEEPGDFSYSYPPFRLHIAKTLQALKRRGLITDMVLPGSTAFGNPIQRHWWYLASEDTASIDERINCLNMVADISGQLAQLQSIAIEKRSCLWHRSE